jgi:SAM-dependent methyltransferase
MTRTTLDRANLVGRRSEHWRPPPFPAATTAAAAAAPPRRARLAAAARRLLDLQARSIWADLATLLPGCRGVVLDVGCGAQPYRPLLPPAVAYRGIDTEEAGRDFGYATPGTTYYRGAAWPVATASVDVVLCTETLEHVADPAAFLAEAARCLRPGGRIILTVPFAARWHYIPHDYWRFTPSGLDRLLTAAGFEQVAVYARGNALTVACSKVLAVLLPFLLPQTPGPVRRLMRRALGVPLAPAALALGLVGALSLRGAGGDDCLGYTALAARGPTPAPAPTPTPTPAPALDPDPGRPAPAPPPPPAPSPALRRRD